MMRNLKPNKQATLYQMFAEKPIAYNPALSRILGSINAGLLMAQLLYWQDKGSNSDWIYKTIENIKKETGLSRSNQETAIKKCVEKGLLEVKLAGVPAKRHFKINFISLISYVNSLQESGKLDRPEPTNNVAEKNQSTTESTPEIKSYMYRNYKNDNKRSTNGFERIG